ncbi:MAG: alpha-amylase family glycosyl hydrolase [Prevotella sp.]|nr:alpha-amylase family glycosyl hydrolase [Prevotella sp.]MCM1074873.1 alpha-amylase family glycosyl hydrolase [Ruminococcus sp.]
MKYTRQTMGAVMASAMIAAASAFAPGAGAQELGDKSFDGTHVDWAPSAVIYEANLRQGTQGRTLKSFSDELPRLKDLGVDIVWLMPIHPISELNRKGTLGSYYAVKDYKAVNPEFGTFDDLKDFVARAHALGMKVILDEVCNHSGCDNAWVKTNPDYYAKDKDGKMFGPFDWTDTYKFDYSNPKMRAAMIDALKFWVKEADIDGYRCDVAMQVPNDFWEDARTELEKIKPVFMLAEASTPELTVKAFDADYAWPMKDVFNAIASTQGVNSYAAAHNENRPKLNALAIDSLLDAQKRQYPQDTYRMQMVTNHDLNSWEGTEFERYGRGLGAFAVLSYTLPGMPMMYTGQEVGFNHAFEFFETDSVTPDYTPNEFTAFYKMLNGLKHTHPALRAGKTGGEMLRYPTTDENVYVFSRTLPEDEVTVFVNLSNQPAPVQFTGNAPTLIGKTDYFSSADAQQPATLAPWEYRIYTAK